MNIQRFFSEPADIAGSDLRFRALYNTLCRAYEEGIDGILYLCEDIAPILSVCNCVKTMETQLVASKYSPDAMVSLIENLDINPLGYNPPVDKIRTPEYLFYITSSFGKGFVLACLEAILDFECDCNSPALIQLRRLNKSKDFDKAQILALLSAYVYELVKLKNQDTPVPVHAFQPPAKTRRDGYVSIDRLFSVAGILLLKHPEQAQLFSDVVFTAVQEEKGSDLDRAQARSRQLLAVVSSIPVMAVRPDPEIDDQREGMATTSQLALLFHYLFDNLGVNFGNSDKTAWARLIHWVTGRNEQNIRKRLSFDFDSRTVKKDLKVVASYLNELFPAISRRIENDSQG